MESASTSGLLTKLALRSLFFRKVQFEFGGFDNLKENSDIFSGAKCIKIYGGELFYKFYNNKKKYGLLWSLINSIKNDSDIQLVFGPSLYVENKEFLALALSHPKNIKLFMRPYRDTRHFKLLKRKDGRILSIVDKKHEKNVKDDDRRSMLWFKGYEEGTNVLLNKFEKAKSECDLINRENLFDKFKNEFITKEHDWDDPKPATKQQINDLKLFLDEKIPEIEATRPITFEKLIGEKSFTH